MRLIFLIILFASTIPFTQACLTFQDLPHPTDEELLRNFDAHQAELDRLTTMCREDAHLFRIAPDFISTHDGYVERPEDAVRISKERWDQYRRLFVNLGIRDGVTNYGPDRVEFLVNDRGSVVGGTSKGYAYLSKQPQELVGSLDEFESRKKHHLDEIAYRHILGNWYLFFEVS